ncbi:MAG: ATP-binding protein [Candidatus Anammoxibacter sp.]
MNQLSVKQKRPIEQKVKFSIRLKFLIGIISIILFVSTAIIFFSMILIRKELTSEIKNRGLEAVKHLAYDSKYGVYTEDKSVLDRVIAGRLKMPDTVYVRISGEDGLVLTEKTREGYDIMPVGIVSRTELDNGVYKLEFDTNSGERLCEFNAPIIMTEQSHQMDEELLDEMFLYGDGTLDDEGMSFKRGAVSICISLKNMETKLNEILCINVFITFVVVVIAIIVSFFFIKVIVNPIKDMTQTAIEISEGDLTKFVDVKSTDEVGVMAHNINMMTASLKNTIEELKELKEGLEDKVQERTEELNIAIRNLENANSGLEKLGALKTDFISLVSHEFRTPLTSIIGFAKLMRNSFMNEIIPKLENPVLNKSENEALKREIIEAQEGADIIVIEGNRLARLVNNVLDISKIEAGVVEWNDEKCSLFEIINRGINTSSDLLEKIRQKRIQVNVEIDDDVPLVFCDKDKLLQVVLNLLANAVKFTDHGTITWRLQIKNGQVEARITDTGIGISKQDMSQVFEKFKQVGNTLSSKPVGTGLGLVICKRIIEHYDGTIWVESELGEGSSFIFTLPI